MLTTSRRADRSRFLQRKFNGVAAETERTHYVGGVEFVYRDANPPTAAAGIESARRPVAGVALETLTDLNTGGRLRYHHLDHLGSIVAFTNELGDLEARMSFDPWGARRNVNQFDERLPLWSAPGPVPSWASAMLQITPRGYTGHEHLDDFGLIHMNGRIYDPRLARFFQADPFMEDTGTLNRYTYVHNNPMNYTDPSGYLSFKEFATTVVSIAITVYMPVYLVNTLNFSKLAAAVVSGAVAGGVSTGSVEGAAWGAFSAALFYGIGSGFEKLHGKEWAQGSALGTDYSAPALALKSASHGVAGGVLTKAQGGRFSQGFLAASSSQLMSGKIDQIDAENTGLNIKRAIAAAIVGGTVSKATGGKFANGALASAFGRAFNDDWHERLLELVEGFGDE